MFKHFMMDKNSTSPLTGAYSFGIHELCRLLLPEYPHGRHQLQ